MRRGRGTGPLRWPLGARFSRPGPVGITSQMTSKSGYLERETKFSATLGFDPPDLRDIAGRTERLPDEDLRTRYFDTPQLRLWSRRITFRHRAGEATGIWMMKLPERQK